MRISVAIILIAFLVTDLLPAKQAIEDSRIKQEIAAIPSGSLVEVRTQGGNRLRGHIVNRGDSDFSLEREQGGGTQTVAYNQVLSVSQVRAGHSHKKWIIIGVVVAAIAIVAIIIGVKASHPLSGAHIGI
jgi:hypothetical protein